jgi:catechol 2,3-dioxygenase-like lactoylglutathione lyase family enzyme
MMIVKKVIPMLRIFDYQKAVEFYVGWLGFKIVWEHYFEPNTPVYMEVEREGITLHLSEHHGDGTPGSHVFIWCDGVEAYHKELIDKNYKYNRPGLGKTFYASATFVVNDPFNNKISFNERIVEDGTERTSE